MSAAQTTIEMRNPISSGVPITTPRNPERRAVKRRAHVQKVCAEHQKRGALDGKGQSERHLRLHQGTGAEHPPDQHEINGDANQGENGSHEDDGGVRVDPERLVEDDDAVHAGHQEVAVGEIQHSHHAEDERQRHCDECIDAAEQQAGNDGLEEGCERHALACSFRAT